MRRLIIANTYFQLIVAIQLRNSLFKDDEVILLISDHSRNTCGVVEILEKLGLFTQTVFLESKHILFQNRTPAGKISDYISIALLNDNRFCEYLKDIDDLYFDELIFYNFAIDMYGIFSKLYSINPYIKVSFFEESILSYNINLNEGNLRYIRYARHLFGKKNITDAFDKFYCFYPNVYKGELSPQELGKISRDSKTAHDLRLIFNLDEKKMNYPFKYIFFTSIFDFEGEAPIGEFELVCKIADHVGKDNLLIKMHPRDTRDLYYNEHFHVDDNSAIPWEAIQLSGNFEDKIFLTVNSSSVLSGSTMSTNAVETFYMYKLCNIEENSTCVRSTNNIERLLNRDDLKMLFYNVKIAKGIIDII